MNNIKTMGYIELFVGSGLLTGFALTGYHQWILSAFVLFGLLCGAIFLTIKDGIASSIKLDQKVEYTIKLAGWYYMTIFALFVIAYIVGCLVGNAS